MSSDLGNDEPLAIRASTPKDLPAIETLYQQAFPEEDLLPVVRALLSGGSVTSLAGVIGTEIVAHAGFTSCTVSGSSVAVALLGPLAVAPQRQRRGIGRTIVERGSDLLRSKGYVRIFVLGDPAYYGRLGFRAETEVTTPYPLPVEWTLAWQSKAIGEGQALTPGRLNVPPPWRHRKLWTDGTD